MGKYPFRRYCERKNHSESWLRICDAIDKEITNDNFLITLCVGYSNSASYVVVVVSENEGR